MKKYAVAAVAIGAVGALVLAGCSSSARTTSGSSAGSSSAAKGFAADATIGVALPQKTSENWVLAESLFNDGLKQAGFKPLVQFANGGVTEQQNQISSMVEQKAAVIVVGAIDGSQLGSQLKDAKSSGATVIAYDRLLKNTDAVDLYIAFDNYKVGQLQGQFIETALGLKDGKGPFNLEPFAGSPDDNNAKFFFSGAWDVLNPYVQSGKLVVPSGKAPKTDADWTSIGIQEWKSETAQSEMQNRINSFYAGGKKIQVVLSPNDSLALGIAQALDAAGYKPGSDWPVLTGQDADKANVLNMLQGKQSMTVWKDTRALGDEVAKMVDQVVKGQTVDVNDTKTYDNGKKVVPTYLLAPQVVTKDNVKSALVDSGFYTASDLGL